MANILMISSSEGNNQAQKRTLARLLAGEKGHAISHQTIDKPDDIQPAITATKDVDAVVVINYNNMGLAHERKFLDQKASAIVEELAKTGKSVIVYDIDLQSSEAPKNQELHAIARRPGSRVSWIDSLANETAIDQLMGALSQLQQGRKL